MRDLKTAIENLSLDELRALGEELAAQENGGHEHEITPRDKGVNVVPLSLAQERLWFLEQLEPLRSTYNLPIELAIEGKLDAEALERSLAELVRRHESLRTRIETTADGQGVQVIDPVGRFRLKVVDLSSSPKAGRRNEALRLMQTKAMWPFDLKQALFRATRDGPAPEHL